MEDEEQSSINSKSDSLKLRAKERKPQGFTGPPKRNTPLPHPHLWCQQFFWVKGEGCSKNQAKYVTMSFVTFCDHRYHRFPEFSLSPLFISHEKNIAKRWCKKMPGLARIGTTVGIACRLPRPKMAACWGHKTAWDSAFHCGKNISKTQLFQKNNLVALVSILLLRIFPVY